MNNKHANISIRNVSNNRLCRELKGGGNIARD